jgi:nicotinamide-nucleotide amidase
VSGHPEGADEGPRRAELIAVGTELLEIGRRDTNSEWLTERLARAGLRVVGRSVVDDDEGRIAGRLRGAVTRADWVFVCGGLGPTGDDLTREGVARALDLPLEHDPAMESDLRRRFRARGFPFDERQARQADRPRGAVWLANPIGSAAGFLVERGATRVAVLPGVPAELKRIWADSLVPILGTGAAPARRILKVAGRPESWVDARVRDLYARPRGRVTVLSGAEAVEVILQLESAAELEAVEKTLTARLGDDLFGRDDDLLAGVVGTLLERRGETVATAESCTAGLLAGTITAVPGASAWFRGGIVAYADDIKIEAVGVARATLERHGAVSAEVARELAAGVRRRMGADHGVGITGIAGPSGGTAEKPVGLVHLACDSASGGAERRLRLPGDRDLIRRRAVTWSLDLLRRSLLQRS